LGRAMAMPYEPYWVGKGECNIKLIIKGKPPIRKGDKHMKATSPGSTKDGGVRLSQSCGAAKMQW